MMPPQRSYPTPVARHAAALMLLLIGVALTLTPSPPAQAIRPAGLTPLYFVPDQVIVSGRAAQVDAVIALVAGSPATLQRIERTSLAYTDGLPSSAPFPFPSGRATLVMDLYQILDSTSVPITVRAINDQAIASGVIVFADPNYATGRPPAITSADPWSVEADPASGDANAAGGLFWDQWAFTRRGIGLFSGSAAQGRSVPFTGARVEVGIFDTSPFTLAGGVTTTLEEIDWITPTLQLSLRHPSVAYSWPAPAAPSDVRDHGLFVAGLTHAIAPASTITLVRVLDQYGQGDLYTLSREMHLFNRRVVTAGASIDGAVINLSLGVHPPPNAAQLALPADIVALLTATQAADGYAIAVVAASGNDSTQAAAAALQIPASYPSVIGVAGSTAQRGRSCFSNQGDLAAPAGNGSGAACKPVEVCTGTCADMLISLVLPGAGESGFAYWPGTSFAAPLATGVAAVLLDARDGALTPAQLAERLAQSALPPDIAADSAALGGGIINLRDAALPFEGFLPAVFDAP